MYATILIQSYTRVYVPSPRIYDAHLMYSRGPTAASNHTHSKQRMFLNGDALVQLVDGIPTNIDILREQLVRYLIFLQHVVIGAHARERGAEEEAE